MMLEELTAFLAGHITFIAAVTVGVVFGLIPILFFIRLYKSAGKEVALLENGWRCEAVILEIWGTGARSGNSQFMGMRLEVHPPVGPAYEARVEETIIPQLLLQKLTAGTRIPVMVARENRNLVGLDIGLSARVPPLH